MEFFRTFISVVVLMMVFGDVQFSATLQNFLKQIRERATNVKPDSLDDLRALLIQCGQLEQAVSDARFGNEHWEIHFQEITDSAARAFLSAYAEGRASETSVERELSSVREKLSWEIPSDAELTVKVPEGYEFYALYPEQYCDSAKHWVNEHPLTKSALVVGIRSIGTSLSAVVAAVLNSENIKTKRVTVRPSGHPFQREIGDELFYITDAEFALIVDEGPGISGSSMVSVVEALANAGMKCENISFFPGHANPPGSAASEKVQSWWKSTTRYFTPLSDMRWSGKTLKEILLEKSSELCGRECSEIDDLSTGKWRKFAYPNKSEWPAANIPFERMKFLCTSRGGKKILWKFHGLGSLYSGGKTSAEKSNELNRPFAVMSIADAKGFVALPWIEGARLREDSPQVLEKMARYILESRGAVLGEEEIESSIARLEQMLRCNLENVFPDKSEICIEPIAESARRFFQENPQSVCASKYGDGHLMPHEWVRAPDGQIFKTDCVGHDADHTLIGAQPVLWDVAGAMIEWDFDSETTENFLRHLEAVCVKVDLCVLEFFLLSYACFRMGQSFLCAEILGSEHPEFSRLQQAAEFYKRKLCVIFSRHHSIEPLARQNR